MNTRPRAGRRHDNGASAEGGAHGSFNELYFFNGIAEELFSTLRFDRLLLEYDTARAGGFEPLRFVPKGPLGQAPIVVLGLVTTKTGRRETADELEARVREAGRFVPLERLALGTQCGFSTSIVGNAVTVEDEEAKLRAISETAARVWPDG